MARERSPDTGGERSRLLAAAADVFARRGYTHATVAEICETADVEVGAFHMHFEEKSELLQRVVERWLSDYPVLDASSVDALGAGIRDLLSSPLAGLLRAWQEGAASASRLREAERRTAGSTWERLRRWVAETRAERGARSSIDDGTVATLVLWTVRSAAVERREADVAAGVLAPVIWLALFGD
jgi:AcrR family transcriptional regulator